VKALAIALLAVRRLFRWRANVFFLFVLPLLIILLLGAAFGGGDARVGVVAPESRRARELVAALDAQPSLDVRRYDDAGRLEDAVEHGRVAAGVLVPAVYDRTLRTGGTARIRFFARPDSVAQDLRSTVDAAVARQAGVLRAARFLVARGEEASFAAALRRAEQVQTVVPPVAVRVTEPSGDPYPPARGTFDSGASTQLLLFVFLTSLNAAIWMIEARRLGVTRRMLATPTSARTVVAGELLGRLGIALTQAAIIVGGSAIVFGVDWGDPAAAAAVIFAFCLVGCGAGLLLGTLARNDKQAGAVALLLGLGLAALGGSMVPLEVFPPAMRTLAHVTPHAWGNDAFTELVRHRGGPADVLPQLAVLLTFAAVLLGSATWLLRRSLKG
jgi:ABC-2 type transport system permease protein